MTAGALSGGRPAKVKPWGRRHECCGEAAAAHVAALPHVSRMGRVQNCREGTPAHCAAGVVTAMGADQVQWSVEPLAGRVRRERTKRVPGPDLLTAASGVDAEPATRSVASRHPAGPAHEEHPSPRPPRPRRQRLHVGGIEAGLGVRDAAPRTGMFQEEPLFGRGSGALARVTGGVRRVGTAHHGPAAGTNTPSFRRRRASTSWSASSMPGKVPTRWVSPSSNVASAAAVASGNVMRRSGSSSTSGWPSATRQCSPVRIGRRRRARDPRRTRRLRRAAVVQAARRPTPSGALCARWLRPAPGRAPRATPRARRRRAVRAPPGRRHPGRAGAPPVGPHRWRPAPPTPLPPHSG